MARSEAGGRTERRAGAARRPDRGSELGDRVRELLPDQVVDELLAGARTEKEITGRGGLLSQMTKRMVERAIEVELTDHLGSNLTPSRQAARGTRATGLTRSG